MYYVFLYTHTHTHTHTHRQRSWLAVAMQPSCRPKWLLLPPPPPTLPPPPPLLRRMSHSSRPCTWLVRTGAVWGTLPLPALSSPHPGLATLKVFVSERTSRKTNKLLLTYELYYLHTITNLLFTYYYYIIIYILLLIYYSHTSSRRGPLC